MARTVYDVYGVSVDKLGDPHDTLMATIDGDKVTGEQAQSVEETLRDRGWPVTPPTKIIHGVYVYLRSRRVPDAPSRRGVGSAI